MGWGCPGRVGAEVLGGVGQCCGHLLWGQLGGPDTAHLQLACGRWGWRVGVQLNVVQGHQDGLRLLSFWRWRVWLGTAGEGAASRGSWGQRGAGPQEGSPSLRSGSPAGIPVRDSTGTSRGSPPSTNIMCSRAAPFRRICWETFWDGAQRPCSVTCARLQEGHPATGLSRDGAPPGSEPHAWARAGAPHPHAWKVGARLGSWARGGAPSRRG